MINLLLLMACTGKAPVSDDSAVATDDTVVGTDDSAITTDDTSVSEELFGTVPDSPVALPVFAATNHLGEARDRDDVLGSRHVLWFFPDAGTYG